VRATLNGWGPLSVAAAVVVLAVGLAAAGWERAEVATALREIGVWVLQVLAAAPGLVG
jgi:hypothetical protein